MRVFLMLIVGGAVLGGMGLLIQPLPVPALAAFFAGLIGYRLALNAPARWPATLAGACIGALAGAAVHGYMHHTEGRMQPEEGLVAHIVLDMLLGLVIAFAALLAAISVSRFLASRWNAVL